MAHLPRKTLPLRDLCAGALPPSRGPLHKALAQRKWPPHTNINATKSLGLKGKV